MGVEIRPLSPFSQYSIEVAKLRVEVFREYPYLYDGTIEYEQRYLSRYIDAPGFRAFGAFDQDRMIGATTGLPLWEENDSGIRSPIAQLYPIESVYYFGESVIEEHYRGQGIGRQFYGLREQAAKALPSVKRVCFCAVDRPGDDPRKPPEYRGPYQLWQRLGFMPIKAKANIAWKELGHGEETQHALTFWVKELRA